MKGLFSHNDRLSDQWHRRIELKLSKHVSTSHNFCSSKPFSRTDITTVIDNLTPEKNNIHKKLPLIMLKAARKAKKKTGSGTRNVLLRGRFVHCRRSPEILRTISNLKLLGRGKSEAEREQVTQSNRRFRFLQRRTIYDCERYKSDVVYRLLRDDRLTFWNRVRSVRFNSYKRANIIDSKSKPKEFFNF